MTGSTKLVESPVLIGVAGGSGSGKTYFAEELRRRLAAGVCAIVCQDNFYVDQSARFDFDGGSVNFDHPSSIDFDLLRTCLLRLKDGRDADIPIYDFATHSRAASTLRVLASKVVLVDGILIFHSELVRNLLDERIFFETSEEVRFQRRMERDVRERGRKPEGVHRQFFQQVKPMHDQFVEPSKAFATLVVREPDDFDQVLNQFVARFAGGFV